MEKVVAHINGKEALLLPSEKLEALLEILELNYCSLECLTKAIYSAKGKPKEIKVPSPTILFRGIPLTFADVDEPVVITEDA